MQIVWQTIVFIFHELQKNLAKNYYGTKHHSVGLCCIWKTKRDLGYFTFSNLPDPSIPKQFKNKEHHKQFAIVPTIFIVYNGARSRG